MLNLPNWLLFTYLFFPACLPTARRNTYGNTYSLPPSSPTLCSQPLIRVPTVGCAEAAVAPEEEAVADTGGSLPSVGKLICLDGFVVDVFSAAYYVILSQLGELRTISLERFRDENQPFAVSLSR
jgi:hypothetical protein